MWILSRGQRNFWKSGPRSVQWHRSRGGEGGDCPLNKNIPGREYLFTPQSFSWTAKNCTKNAPQIAILRSKIKKFSEEKVVAPPKYIWIDAAGSVWRNYFAVNHKQVFANSVILFRSLPVNQKRSKLTGLCKKQVLRNSFIPVILILQNFVSRYSHSIYL